MYTLPELGYNYDALEPFIDARTMEIHHKKHHQTYIDKLNKALEKYPKLQNRPVEELIRNLSMIPEDIRTAVQNHGGGHANHSFFWKILKKNVEPSGEILKAINKKFKGIDNFKKLFKDAATTLFGSGWVWLVFNGKELEIIKTPNQDNPITNRKIPLLGLDVWEHAYYLKYQNRRPEYVDAFFNVINWKQVNDNFLKAKK